MTVSAKLAAPELRPLRKTREAELQSQIERIFRRLRMAVVYAGDKAVDGAVIHATSSPRSWKSYEPVARDIAGALERLGCQEVVLIPEDMRLGERLKKARSHLVWLNTGGVQGSSSMAHAPSILELLGVPYVGHAPLAAAMLDNKLVFKRQLKAAGIATAPFLAWHPSYSPADPTADIGFESVFADWTEGFIVKPVSGRASLHVSYVPERAGLRIAAENIFRATKSEVMIEGYLAGKEYCIAVCGPTIAIGGRLERFGEPFVFAALERVLEPGEHVFTSMDLKPITASRARQLDTLNDAAIIGRLSAIARMIFEQLRLDTLIRLDLRANSMGDLFVLEANPKPDLKAPSGDTTSLICLGLDSLGMSYDDLILSILADRIDHLLARDSSAGHHLRVLAQRRAT